LLVADGDAGLGIYEPQCYTFIDACAAIQNYDEVTGAITSPQIDEEVIVEGVVYVAPGTYSYGSGGYLIDDTGGINFWSDPPELDIQEGDFVRITGPLWSAAGEVYVGNYQYEKSASNMTVSPAEYTVTELLSDYDHVGDFARVEGTITSMEASSFWLSDGTTEVEILLSSYAGLSVNSFSIGMSGWVQGPCTVLYGAMNVKPRRGADLNLGIGGPSAVDLPGFGRFALHAAAPNPFNPSTTIRFNLPQSSAVALTIYDLQGKLVRTLLNGEVLSAGRNEMSWRGRDDAGRRVASGTYFYRLEAAKNTETRQMTLIK